jgi:uncharacterized protein YfaS (alpha-2-macroglobulin family)
VRLPVIVQPALPRFVRPGDRFAAAGIGRIVEGEGGAGTAELEAEGLTLGGPSRQAVTFDAVRATPLRFPVTVDTPEYTAEGALVRESVTLRMGVSRTSDGASDAFQVVLPIRDDRREVVTRQTFDLAPGASVTVPAIPEAARAGTIRRSFLVSDEPALVRMAGALDFFSAYPYGCTEQRISKARAYLALGALRATLHMQDGDARMKRAVDDTLAWLPTAVDGQGLVGFWPGSDGTVALTAWAVEFLVDAKAAGYPVDATLQRTLTASLERGLRSNYGRFVTGESYTERAMALQALALTGKFDPAYYAELARMANFMDAEGVASVVVAGARSKQGDEATNRKLTQMLSGGVVVQLYQGREVYGGLQAQRSGRSGLILPSETRTLATIARALIWADPENERLPLVKDALVTLGGDDGWGTTNANAAAMLALTDQLRSVDARAPWSVGVTEGASAVDLTAVGAVGYGVRGTAGEARVELAAGGPARGVLRVDTRYLPAKDGSQVAPESHGFVVARTVQVIRPSGPPDRTPLTAAGATVTVKIGDVIEEHVQVVNPEARFHVAVMVPLAAGLEPLNPRLLTSPPEARTTGQLTLSPSYTMMLDDQVAWFYNELPKGTYDFYFRTRATVAGEYVQPAALAEAMYDGAVTGRSAGARIVVGDAAP